MNTPRAEYPRPQLVREDWLNLNGPWGFAFDPGRSGMQRGLPAADALPGEIIVPFCPESALSGIGDIDFPPRRVVSPHLPGAGGLAGGARVAARGRR
jgi:hypothetical protein